MADTSMILGQDQGETAMRYLLPLLFLLAAFTTPAHAQSDADKVAIQTVISSQIAAFRQDDAARAFSFAAPNIQQAFAHPQIFLQMVRRGYEAVYRPKSFVFDPLTGKEGRWLQPVRVIGPDDQSAVAVYVMEQQPSGEWKIAGVFMADSSDQRA
jgi:hypothetical protein